MQGLPRKVSVGLLVLVFVVSVYRARTQFFTVDEAFVFNLFVNKELATFALEYDACNHVLHTLLTKLFRDILGISEPALRLSSLLGCALYLWASFRLALLYFGERWAQVLAVAVLTLNPLTMDFFVASRGYGLALAMLLWSFYGASRYWMCGRERRWLASSGVFAGLAVAANLTMVVPVTALGVVLSLMALREWRTELARLIDGYAGPAVVTAFVFVIIPLLRANRDDFYYGLTTFVDFVRYLLGSSLTNAPDRWPTNVIVTSFPFVLYVAVPVLSAAIIATFIAVAVRFVHAPNPLPYRLVPFLLFGGTVASSALLVVILRQLGVLYPLGRTGLYFIPLLTFPVVLAGRLVVDMRPPRLRWLPYGISTLLVLVYLTQIDGRFFAEWRYDAATGKLLRHLQANVQFQWHEDRQPVVAASPVLKPTIEYYRVRRRMDWLGELVTESIGKTPADYYILIDHERSSAQKLGLQLLYEDPVSKAVLARRPS